MQRFNYPHTIDHGTGERLTFVRRVPGAGCQVPGARCRVPGAGCQANPAIACKWRMWQAQLFRRGEAHNFWNARTDALRCTGYVEPADNIEYFLAEIFDSQKRSGSARPRVFDSAYLLRRYQSEFAVLVIPGIVQRVAFPVLIAVGTLVGRCKRYANAPTPIRR